MTFVFFKMDIFNQILCFLIKPLSGIENYFSLICFLPRLSIPKLLGTFDNIYIYIPYFCILVYSTRNK